MGSNTVWVKKNDADQTYHGMSELEWATIMGLEGVVTNEPSMNWQNIS